MAAFEFQALDAAGRKHKGVLQSDTAKAARQLLRERGLTPVDVSEVKVAAADRQPLFERGLDRAQLAVLTRQFATLVRAGLPLDEVLAALAEQADSTSQRKLLASVRARMLEGISLERALAEHPRVFDALYCAAIAAGEHSGQLGVVLERLADHLESRANTASKLGQVLVYPALLFVVAIAVAVALLTQVVPQVVNVFSQAKVELPLLTRFMLGLSSLLQHSGIAMLLALLAGVVGTAYAWRQARIRLKMDRWLLRVPVLGKILLMADAARFSRTMGLASAAAVPMLEALKVATQVVENRHLRAQLDQARARVREGAPLAASLREHTSMPSLLTRMVLSGERSGELTEMLERSADLQERQLATRLGTLTALVEPMLILIMGGVVLVIVLSVVMPIFELNRILR